MLARNFLIALSILSFTLNADVVMDGSLGGNEGQSVSSGNNVTYFVDESLGTLNGSNLFYSFDEFSVAQGESALFSGQSSVANVISRVTGGQISQINGRVTSDYTGANLWLLNSAGVVLGSTAEIDVDGSFYTSSANSVTFDTNNVFVTDDSSNMLLSIGTPQSYGFLSTNNSLVSLDATTFNLASGEQLSLSASQMDVDNLTIRDRQNIALQFLSPEENGVIALDGPSEMAIAKNGSQLNISNLDLLIDTNQEQFFNAFSETISIDNSTVVASSVNTDIHPKFALSGESIFISDTSRLTLSTNLENAKGVSAYLHATGTLTIQDTGSRITTSTFVLDDGATAGSMNVTARNIQLLGGGAITASVSGTNQTGSKVDIVVTEELLLNDGSIEGRTSATTNGQTVDISAVTITMLGGVNTVISSDNTGLGDGALLMINADTILVSDSASITVENSRGQSGGMDITADRLTVDTDGLISTLAFGDFQGGNITLDLGQLTVTEGGQISVGAVGGGGGGTLLVNAHGKIKIDGKSSENDTGLFGRTGIDLEDERGTLPDYGTGLGGDVILNARTIELTNKGKVSSESGRTGDAGSITIGSVQNLVTRLNMDSSSQIATSAPNSRGGNISIYVDKFIGITDSSITAFAGSEDATASGGDIFIDPELFYLNNATISANANGGNGGNIQIVAANIIQNQNTQITASSNRGINGDITLDGVINEVSSLETIKVPYSDISDMLYQRCNVAQLADRSSFVVSGGETVTYSPDAYQSSNLDDSQNQLSSIDTSNLELGRLAMLASCTF